ncbi:glycosyltransferase family 2 protein [Nesterenkonia haasae]|uniref:glycosyltransferase family 2 protein n=1 Tax=Nesterenkonia haasae TaxID=2587813 RepID=UPI001391AF7D|nr:glycosyltransferase family 2 protein [Nesterenkonia haasae]NDK32604.1 glycosyltransferase family 2 protein [Nesterenkonia haasae]
MKTLSLIVPSYNSADYLHRCLDTLIPPDQDHDVEVIVVDDGSTDSTAAIAQRFVDRRPDRFRLISQPNGGHGEAINTGLSHATGQFFKVVDSDDWVEERAYARLLSELRKITTQDRDVDMVVSNYVYEKAGRRRRASIRYGNVIPPGKDIGWDQVGRFRPSQYLLMHALTYRTELLRRVQLRLPQHMFYVDNLFAYIPLAHVRKLRYVDVDFYRYFIGRPDQSVNEKVMISRLDQQLRINRLMIQHLGETRRAQLLPKPLDRYMVHYLGIITAVSSTMALRGGSREMLQMKQHLWSDLRRVEPTLYLRLRRSIVGRLVNLPGHFGRSVSLVAYKTARWAYGFN